MGLNRLSRGSQASFPPPLARHTVWLLLTTPGGGAGGRAGGIGGDVSRVTGSHVKI